MRWMVPWFLLSLLLVSILLYNQGWIYSTLLALQIVFYGIVLIGLLISSSRDNFLVRIPYYFVQVNVAIAHATIAYMLGKRIVTWNPTKR